MSVSRPRRRSLVTLGFFAAFAVASFTAVWLFDYFVVDTNHHTGAGPFRQLLDYDAETMQNALGSLSQVIAAVLGIAITVVSIVVQLAATRYTSRVADLFFRDRINLGVMGFFVVACVEALWVSFTVRRDYVPQATITVTVLMASGSVLLLVPYFAYVFDFLDPEKVIARIGAETLDRATSRKDDGAGRHRRHRAPGPGDQRPRAPGRHRGQRARAEGQGDRDRRVGGAAPAAGRVSGAQGRARRRMVRDRARVLRADPDFVALAADSLDDLATRRTWLEWKGLRQIREVFGAALTTMPEMAHVVAIDTRYVGEAALAAGDREVLVLTVKFMNTYLRAALNARDVRTAYNVLNQYRQLAESLLETRNALAAGGAGRHRRPLQVLRAARARHRPGVRDRDRRLRHVRAVRDGERAYDAACHDRLLAVFLEIDREPETQAEEHALRGVRKAQAKLASYYLLHDQPARARRIYDDMASESPGAAAIDSRRDACHHLEGLLGGRRPRHQLRLPVRRAQSRSCASSSPASPRSRYPRPRPSRRQYRSQK